MRAENTDSRTNSWLVPSQASSDLQVEKTRYFPVLVVSGVCPETCGRLIQPASIPSILPHSFTAVMFANHKRASICRRYLPHVANGDESPTSTFSLSSLPENLSIYTGCLKMAPVLFIRQCTTRNFALKEKRY